MMAFAPQGLPGVRMSLASCPNRAKLRAVWDVFSLGGA